MNNSDDMWGQISEDVENILGQLIGPLPRGEFRKFCREIYPGMQNYANRSGTNVYCFWFGDIIGVRPNGEWEVVGRPETLTGFYAWVEDHAKIYEFAVLDCGAGPETGSCHYDVYGEGKLKETVPAILAGAVTTKTALYVGLAAVGAIVLFAVIKK